MVVVDQIAHTHTYTHLHTERERERDLPAVDVGREIIGDRIENIIVRCSFLRVMVKVLLALAYQLGLLYGSVCKYTYIYIYIYI